MTSPVKEIILSDTTCVKSICQNSSSVLEKPQILENMVGDVSDGKSHLCKKANLVEDPFLFAFGERDDDAFHQMMSINDNTYSELFSDDVFLNEDWYKPAIVDNCGIMGVEPRYRNELVEDSVQSADTLSNSGSKILTLPEKEVSVKPGQFDIETFNSYNDSIKAFINNLKNDPGIFLFMMIIIFLKLDLSEEDMDLDSNDEYVLAQDSLDKTPEASADVDDEYDDAVEVFNDIFNILGKSDY